ncbi:Magnesium transporter MRS2-I, variant 2 [Stylosanthes scabra]|uniref:Magnesium transporter n=1 Tax=Stylosanthes scabra TaxID=79078 RepID=A0ABU6WB38_9FABA|nr:Magnesium transporter MRS2-I, variant 2 [Stylosanthes scabra]
MELQLKKSAVSRSWILLEQDGSGAILDVDKYAIMRMVDIHARDLRILDPLLSYPSTILGREKVIVLNLEHIKAIITAEKVFVRDPADDDVVPIVEELRRRLPKSSGDEEPCAQGGGQGEDNGSLYPIQIYELKVIIMFKYITIYFVVEFPFEFRALEVALEAICSFLDARTIELETAAYPALDELTSQISSRNLDRVRKLKSAMTRLTNRVQKIRDELENLLDDDDDMADLYLSKKLANLSSPASSFGAHPNWLLSSPNPDSKIHGSSKASTATSLQVENDVEELEMLLEAYFTQIDGTLNKLNTLREYIDDTEDYINIQLDSHRNQLIQLELFLSSGTVCLSIFSLVAAIFGMNIPYTWKDGHGYMFKWVSTYHIPFP